MSQNAGGLIRWPVLGAGAARFRDSVGLQALSELIKRVAFLTGHRSEPFSGEHDKSAEELLAEELAAEAAQHERALAAGKASEP